jgi:hypothetical protein
MASAIIHDVAYDFFGQRVATCSSDHMIRIYDAAGNKTGEWRAHSGSIWRLSWAHPEFGVALASCSFDRRVCVWEENLDAEEVAIALASDSGVAAGAKAPASHWVLRKEFTDARDSVVDVQFAPHHFGQVLLASCGADGSVRIYEAPDVLDLHTWEPHSEFDAAAAAVESLAESSVGGAGGGEGGLSMCAAAGGSSALLSPPPSTPALPGAHIAPGMSGVGVRASGADGSGSGFAGPPEPLCLAWGTSVVEPPMLVVGMSDGCVLVGPSPACTRAHALTPCSPHTACLDRWTTWRPQPHSRLSSVATLAAPPSLAARSCGSSRGSASSGSVPAPLPRAAAMPTVCAASAGRRIWAAPFSSSLRALVIAP